MRRLTVRCLVVQSDLGHTITKAEVLTPLLQHGAVDDAALRQVVPFSQPILTLNLLLQIRLPISSENQDRMGLRTWVSTHQPRRSVDWIVADLVVSVVHAVAKVRRERSQVGRRWNQACLRVVHTHKSPETLVSERDIQPRRLMMSADRPGRRSSTRLLASLNAMTSLARVTRGLMLVSQARAAFAPSAPLAVCLESALPS